MPPGQAKVTSLTPIARIRTSALAAGAALSAALGLAPQAGAQAIPILQNPFDATAVPAFIGEKATPYYVEAPAVPRHPHMAPNGDSSIHDDGYQTDTYTRVGPLGNRMTVTSTFLTYECASVTFDSHGRIVAVCVGISGPLLMMFDATTLETLATMVLPQRAIGANTVNFLTDVSGGGYFYLDHRDRAVIPTQSRHVYVVAQTDGPGFVLERDHDLSTVVPAGDRISSALPDWDGRLWFVSYNGLVGTIDPASGAVTTLDLHEEIENSFAVDDTGGVYVVSNKSLYRLDAGPRGVPSVTWKETYSNSGLTKPGQFNAGSGTTPTLMGSRYVAIADNADPMNVVVYRRERDFAGRRQVCVHPVFRKGAGSTENSIVATGTAMVVENNYGYTGPTATQNGGVTEPGLQRVDLDSDGDGCHSVWTSGERAPSVVPKLSLANGLVYTYTKEPNPEDVDAWYLTALDFNTGRTVYKQLAGTGLGFNNHYAPVTLGRDGTAYVGALGGLIALRDATPPVGAKPPAVTSGAPRPRLTLRVRRTGRRRARATVTGADRHLVRRVTFSYRGRRLAVQRRAPFAATLRLRRTRRADLRRVRARVTLKDERALTLRPRLGVAR